MIVQPVVEPMDRFAALVLSCCSLCLSADSFVLPPYSLLQQTPENVKSKLKWDLQVGHQADFDLGKYAAMMFPNLWIKETAANIVEALVVTLSPDKVTFTKTR